MAAVTTSVTELPESRVRVDAEVAAEEVERRVLHAAREFGREMRVPGFRKGKVPPKMVLQRVGRGAVLDEAVRDSLPGWYVEAIDAAGIAPVGDPRIDLADLPGEGDPLRFTIEIGIRPEAQLGNYKGLEVGRREPDVPEAAIDAELEALRDHHARLETVEQAAAQGDFAVIDFAASVDGEPLEDSGARDELVELGAGRMPSELDRGLVGASAGETREIDVTFPAEHSAERLAGRTARFEVTVKEVKRKQLPDLDDEFAADAAGFDSVAELRGDVRAKLEERDRAAIESEFREAVLDAAAAASTIQVPEALADARAQELWGQLSRTLAGQGISSEAYLRISGRTEDEIVAEARPDAERGLRREAVVDALIEAEGIEPTEEELLESLEPVAEREGTKPSKLLKRIRDAGRLDALRRDLAARAAVDLLVGEAKAISVEQAQARDKLWTPGRDEPEEPAAGRLWTPG